MKHSNFWSICPFQSSEWIGCMIDRLRPNPRIIFPSSLLRYKPLPEVVVETVPGCQLTSARKWILRKTNIISVYKFQSEVRFYSDSGTAANLDKGYLGDLRTWIFNYHGINGLRGYLNVYAKMRCQSIIYL